MKKQLVDKLWRSSQALFFREDDLGMAELTPKGAMIAYTSTFITFVIIAALIGGL